MNQMHYTFVAPAMPVYDVGTTSRVVTVAPNTVEVVSFKRLRALKSIWVSDITAPKAPGTAVTNSVTIKIFASPALTSAPPENSTSDVLLVVKDYFGYIPVMQLMPGGDANVYIYIRNHSTTNTIVVAITGEA